MTKRRSSPPPPTSVPAKKPASSVAVLKPPSTLDSMRGNSGRAKAPAVLLIDDEDAIITTWAEILKREGMDIGVAGSAREGVQKFREREWDVIVTDLRLGDSDGVSLLNEISREAPATISIVLTGFPTLPSAISAIRAGVHDYLIKPCKVQDMLTSIKRGLSKREAIQAETVAKRASIEELKRLARLNVRLTAELNRLRRQISVVTPNFDVRDRD